MSKKILRLKKVLAGLLAVTMIVANSAMVFADEEVIKTGNATGTNTTDNTSEGYVDKDVFRVQVPTITDDTFKFILDPQKLINDTGAAAHSGKDFESGKTVFFKRTSGNEASIVSDNMYTAQSDVLSVNNVGGKEVKATVKFAVNDARGLNFIDGDPATYTWNAANVNPEIILKATGKMEGEDAGAEHPVSSNTVSNGNASSVAQTLPAITDNLSVSWNEADGYYLKALSANDTGFKQWDNMKFYIVGAANPYGNYNVATAPKIDVVWSIEDASGPSITLTYDGLLTVKNLTPDKNYKKIMLCNLDPDTLNGFNSEYALGDRDATWHVENWNAEEGGYFTANLAAGWFTNWKGGLVKTVLYLQDSEGNDAGTVESPVIRFKN